MKGLTQGASFVVTFTRTAAADLSNELTNLGVPGCEHINAGTLHSFCFKMLRSSEALAAHNRYPRPLIAVENRGWLGFELGPLLADLNNADVFGNQKNESNAFVRLRLLGRGANSKRLAPRVTPLISSSMTPLSRGSFSIVPCLSVNLCRKL